MKSIREAEQALREYADHRGWPSQSEWNKYAKENSFLSHQGIYYYTKKSWNAYRDFLGYPQREHVFTKEECLAAIKEATYLIFIPTHTMYFFFKYLEKSIDMHLIKVYT